MELDSTICHAPLIVTALSAKHGVRAPVSVPHPAWTGQRHSITAGQCRRSLNSVKLFLRRPLVELGKVAGALKKAVATQSVFTSEELDCISGIETGRTWNPNVVATNGRVGLFQFNQASWRYSGTKISWSKGKSAQDPYTAGVVALGLLFRDLGYNGVQSPTGSAITEAIDKFGEHDGHYGQAVMDCSKKLATGDFAGAYTTLVHYATWKVNH